MLALIILLSIALLLLLYIYELLGRKLTVSEIDRKAVLITGCGSGFGRDLVKRCLQNGLTVFAGCRRAISVKELEESYSSISQGRLYAFQMDVTDDKSVQKSREIVDRILREKNLVLHALVNNAGIRGNIFYDDFLILDDYKEVWEVNVCGVIRVTQTFRDLIKKSRGRIVMCSSSVTLLCVPGYGPYSSSKCALQAYTDVIRHELGSYGVQVVAVTPGSFSSGMQEAQGLKNMIDTVWNRASEDLREEYGHNYIDKAKAFVNNLQSKVLSKDTTWVINSYYEAIVARRPKLSNIVGWDALLLFYPISWLPPFMQKYVVRLALYLSHAPLPAVVKKRNLKSN
ncbi:unnamed protein product [Litomosoides sigmodontis]|uniref:Uncharacterized protein n=1 Tax=Litomosoides sigmodontis TaxID=42156 RepID=A0A3P6TT80_LITSI|nr:unnamed protein product [Litomosoides sigmodontis]